MWDKSKALAEEFDHEIPLMLLSIFQMFQQKGLLFATCLQKQKILVVVYIQSCLETSE